MTYTLKLSRRLAVLWSQYWGMFAPLLLLTIACSDNELPTGTAAGSGWEQVDRFEVSPNWVYAEVNQPIQLLARQRPLPRVRMDELDDVEWTASGGSITVDGLFSAQLPGEYQVVGRRRRGKKSDTTTVEVGDTVPKVVALVLTPDTVVVQPVEARQFVAKGVLGDGSAVPIGTVWSADGGTIDAGGKYVAGSTPGRYHVIATNVSGSLADTAAVDVALAAPGTDPSWSGAHPWHHVAGGGWHPAVRGARAAERWRDDGCRGGV